MGKPWYANDKGDGLAYGRLVAASVLVAIMLMALVMWGCPTYNVWEQGLVGQAALRRAEQDRQIAVQEARARLDSAKLLAEAEVERARGVAQANAIIGEGLRGHEEYLRYLWIMSLEHTAASPNGSTVVYVPTETNLPILEARRLGPTAAQGVPQQ